MKWSEVIDLHNRAAHEASAVAEAIAAERWRTPLAEGKWTPAEVVEHLTLGYDIFLKQLAGGEGMVLKTKWWMQIMLRLTMVPGILKGKGFPKGARAPREVRPATPSISKEEAIDRLRKRAKEFDAAIVKAQAGKERLRLTHAYFGRLSLPDAVVLCARHIEHHTAQMR
jgi:hypothetical protein